LAQQGVKVKNGDSPKRSTRSRNQRRKRKISRAKSRQEKNYRSPITVIGKQSGVYRSFDVGRDRLKGDVIYFHDEYLQPTDGKKRQKTDHGGRLKSTFEYTFGGYGPGQFSFSDGKVTLGFERESKYISPGPEVQDTQDTQENARGFKENDGFAGEQEQVTQEIGGDQQVGQNSIGGSEKPERGGENEGTGKGCNISEAEFASYRDNGDRGAVSNSPIEGGPVSQGPGWLVRCLWCGQEDQLSQCPCGTRYGLDSCNVCGIPENLCNCVSVPEE
jgi:hypothetical protein